MLIWWLQYVQKTSKEQTSIMKIITLGTAAGDPTPTRFNVSTLLECGSSIYLIDAGAPAAALMIRKKVDMNRLRAVFLSHMHEDHFGGLSGILKNRIKYLPEGVRLEVFMTEKNAPLVFERLMELSIKHSTDRISYKAVADGVFYDDGVLRVSGIPTRHFESAGQDYPSFAFLLEAEGKRILYTGDLKNDFSDFPVSACRKSQVCICELTHYKLEEALPVFARMPLKKLIFTHIGLDMPEQEEIQFIKEKTACLPYEAIVASDGDEFEV